METLTLTELGDRLVRRWRTVVAGGVVGLLLGIALQAALPTTYEATTVLFVDTTTPDLVDMTAERAVATSRRVTSEALDALGEPGLTIDELERSSRADAVDDSRLLRVTYAAADPRLAARGADAVAQAYVAVRSLDATGTGVPVTSATTSPAPHPAVVDGTVVDPARTPTAPVGPAPWATVVAGLVGGLLAAAPVAMRPRRTTAAPAS